MRCPSPLSFFDEIKDDPNGCCRLNRFRNAVRVCGGENNVVPRVNDPGAFGDEDRIGTTYYVCSGRGFNIGENGDKTIEIHSNNAQFVASTMVCDGTEKSTFQVGEHKCQSISVNNEKPNSLFILFSRDGRENPTSGI